MAKINTKTIIWGLIFFTLILGIPKTTVAQCLYHTYQMCSDGHLYWYDSCGNRQDVAQYCSYGCNNNSCQNYYNYNYYGVGACTPHAYKLCLGNSIYWFSGCHQQQELIQNCADSGQICKYGQCINSTSQTIPTNYNPYYAVACWKGSLYWYDSLGVVSGLYKSCQDNNSCTQDSCLDGGCINVIKCDGSTCPVNSTDYNTYCATTKSNQENTKNQESQPVLIVSFMAKQDSESSQWQKIIEMKSGSLIYFIVSITNNSTVEAANINVSVDIPDEISSIENLKTDGLANSGNLASGIEIASLAPLTTKTITFEGKTGTILTTNSKQATVKIKISDKVVASDSISLNFVMTQPTAAVSEPLNQSGFIDFFKKWYLWILGGGVLISLFVIIFKRFSSEI